jgi:uncharacterized protein Usg
MAVSPEFRRQCEGYGLTLAEIIYRFPDHPRLLQTFVWQDYDVAPKFPELKGFLLFWETKLDGPIFSVRVSHQMLIRPVEMKFVDGDFRLN